MNATKSDPSKNERPARVLFVNPPSLPYSAVKRALDDPKIIAHQSVSMPMGILYLAAVLEKELPGIEIRIIDYAKAIREFCDSDERYSTDFDSFSEQVLNDLVPADFVPDMVGISTLFSTAHKSTGHIADAIRKRWQEAPIIVGGMHATNSVEKLLEMPAVNYVCRGEAESIISDLVRCLRKKGDGETVKGIIGPRKFGGGASCLESAPLIDDLDEIPFPAWHLIPVDQYTETEGRAKHLGTIDQDKMGTIVTTRGCPFSCTFCASWTVHGRKMRYRSVENVIQELELLYGKYGINCIVPEDDLFTVKKPRIIELCDAITERFKRKIYFEFPNGLSVATLDEDVIAAMVRMGMQVANIAIESGSHYVQRNIIKKNCSLDRARRVVQICRDAGVLTRCYFIVGFPGETREMMQETFDFASSLPSDWNAFSIAAPLVGTEMYDQMLERKEIDESFNWDNAFYSERMFDTKEIKAEELKKWVYDSNIRINFFENTNLQLGRYDRAKKIFQDILTSYPEHLVAQYCIGIAMMKMGDERGWQDALAKCRKMLDENSGGLPQKHMDLYPDLLSELVPVNPHPVQKTTMPSEFPRSVKELRS